MKTYPQYITIATPRSDGDYDVRAALIRPEEMSDVRWGAIVELLVDQLAPGAEVLYRQDVVDVLDGEDVEKESK